jgi:predicted outer membrane repeat protein
MKTARMATTTTALLVLTVMPLTTGALEHSGDVWGVWTRENSPHVIVGDLRVPQDSILTIEEGCGVLFAGSYRFVIDTVACLRALGSEESPIVFDGQTPEVEWCGLRFLMGNNSSVLQYCRLQRGRATRGGLDSHGGAIFCNRSSPSISDCTFEGNSAPGYGGAIYCISGSNPRIFRCLFTANKGHYGGGAISCWNSSTALIEACVFAGNTADYGGGAIFASTASPRVANCTFTRNSSSILGGGAIYCTADANPILRNCILWNDSAWVSPEIYSRSDTTPTVSYCDVQGGWAGIGNMDVNPLFVNPDSANLHLHWGSGCIDSGDPVCPLDPDSTRADMGAFSFNQDSPFSIELYPRHQPLRIPGTGGMILYDGWVYNLTDTMARLDIWTYAILPSSTRFGPLRFYPHVRLPAGGRIGLNNIGESVPAFAPVGAYTYLGYVGSFGSTTLDSSWFALTKEQMK